MSFPSLTELNKNLRDIILAINNVYATLKSSLPVFTPGQLPGTATNDNANTGNVGEYLTASVAQGSAISISNTTPKTVVTLPLTAGDWDVWGNVGIVPAAGTTVSQIEAGINTTTNTLPAGTDPSFFNMQWTFTTADVQQLPVGATRVSLAAPGNAYLVIDCAFAVSTNTAFGALVARRRR